MKKRLFLLMMILTIAAGCSNTPDVLNIQSTVDSAVSTALAPYEDVLQNGVSADMLATSQAEQNEVIAQYVNGEIDNIMLTLESTPETSAAEPDPDPDPVVYVESGGTVATATSSSFSYDNTNCVDRFTYVSDLTIADGMTITPNTVFEKSWYITNTGTCTWNSGYKVVYMSGDTVGTAKSFSILQPGYFVRPGESTVVSATMTAPDKVGSSFSSYWAIESDTGEKFGSGTAKNIYLSANFRVDSSFNVAQNFGSLICADDSGYFTCGLRNNGDRGVVYYDSTPMLESTRSQGVPAIVVGLPAGENTTTRFEFGPLRFPRKSMFYTNFCCRPDTPTCDVMVRLYVREPGYGERLIAEDREWNDGFMGEWKFVLDDVSIFDQEFVYILEVQANGGADSDDLILFTNTRLY